MPYSDITQRLHRRVLASARGDGRFARLFHDVAFRRAQEIVDRVRPLLADGSHLEIGCGTGHVASVLGRDGAEVLAVDLEDLRAVDVPFLQGNATSLPLDNKRFDNVLLVTVLHHIDGGLHAPILREAVRVARRRVILVEDGFQSEGEARYVKVLDRLFNLDFGPHPHSNRRTSEWAEMLRSAGCARVETMEQIVRFLGLPLRQSVIAGFVA